MADGSAPAQDITARSDGFRAVAEAAGVKLKDALQRDLVPAISNPAYLFFDIKSFDIETPDGRSNLLKKLMDDFEKEVDSTIIGYKGNGQLIHSSRNFGASIPSVRLNGVESWSSRKAL
ncbi:hypothetical protein Q7P37_009880 [Cladosporium fusiforme]